jgi:hypothetical protein
MTTKTDDGFIMPKNNEEHKDRLIDIGTNFMFRAKIFVGFIMFLIILFILSDFFTQYILLPVGLADLDLPNQKGYIFISGLISLLFIFIDIIHQKV